jgi:anti-sigma-K factor RskA
MPVSLTHANHTEEFEQLAGLYALRVLEGEELARFEQHRQSCKRCELTVRLDREALQRLTLAAPEMDPSADFKQRLLRRAAQELVGTHPAVSAAPRPAPRPPPFWRRQVWALPLAAIFVLAVGVAGIGTYMNQVVAQYALAGSGPGSGAVLIRRSGAAELELRGLADAPPGFVYEAWIIGSDNHPVPAGTTPKGQTALALSGPVRGSTVAVTLERAPGADAPSQQPFLAVAVQS